MADTISSSYDLKFPMETYTTTQMTDNKIKNWTLKIPNPVNNLSKMEAVSILDNVSIGLQFWFDSTTEQSARRTGDPYTEETETRTLDLS